MMTSLSNQLLIRINSMIKMLLMLMLLGFVRTQSPSPETVSKASSSSSIYPPECVAILNNSSDNSYPVTSVAKGFNTFCPVFNEFADCLDRNRALLRNSSNILLVVLADHWDKNELKRRMANVCTRLKEVSSEIECFKNVSSITACSEHTMNLLNKTRSLNDLCQYMHQIYTCYRNAARGMCSEKAIGFHTSYLYVFVPQNCIVPNYEPVVTTGGPDSVIIGCAEDNYPEMLSSIYKSMGGSNMNNIRQKTGSTLSADMSRIIFESFESICRNRTTFHKCVQRHFKPPFMTMDALLDKILDHTKIGYALDQLCDLELSPQEDTCLEESSKGMVLCSWTLSMNERGGYNEGHTGSTQSSLTTQNSTVSPIDYICPSINIIDKCIVIQLKRCSPRLGKAFSDIIKHLVKPECQAAEIPKHLSANVFTSALTMCGFPLTGEIVSQFQKYNENATKTHISNEIRDLVPVSCGYVDFYTTCIARELPKSVNIFDKIALELFDLTNADRLKTVFNAICSKTKVIQENIDCLKKSFLNESALSCLQKEKYRSTLFRKYQNIFDLDFTTIKEICSPIKEIGLCEANVMSKCSEDLATTGKMVVLELLRTDCGGERPLTSGIRKYNSYFMLYIGLLMMSIVCKTS